MDKLEDKNVKHGTEGELRQCPLCGGGFEEKRITHPQQYEGKIIILENVPAKVCRQCGEVLLAPNVVGQLQKVVWAAGAPKRTAQVPVYDLTDAS